MSPPKRAFPALGIRENTRMTVTVREALFIHPFPVGNVRNVSAQGGSAVFFHVRPASVSARFRVRFRARLSGRTRWPAPREKSARCPPLIPGMAAGISS